MKKTKLHQAHAMKENGSTKLNSNSMDQMIMDRFRYLQLYISMEDLKRAK